MDKDQLKTTNIMVNTEEAIWIMFPIIIMGFVALAIKNYLHFKYFKIVKNYHRDLGYADFHQSFYKYFFDQMQILLPLFLSKNKDGLSKGLLTKANRLKNYIFTCLTLFYLGILMIVLGKIIEGNYFH